jgi:hypothetical protein
VKSLMPAEFQKSLVSQCLINLNARNVPFLRRHGANGNSVRG